ncbi:MAG: SEC-C metal-binding domain-containing protein, partial [Bryobacteraceae bacterium]
RNLLESPSTPPAVRLRAALAVLRGDLLATSDLLSDWPPAAAQSPAAHPTEPQAPWPPKPEATPVALATAARNAPCPCGSKLKFKRCCGQSSPPLLFPAAPGHSTSTGS